VTSGPRFLGELRDRLLDQVLGLLKADTAVDGVALIGSLGRGEADNWSDIDLLILMGDRALARKLTCYRMAVTTHRLAPHRWAQRISGQGCRSGLTCMFIPQLGRVGPVTAASSSNAGQSRPGLCHLMS